MPNAESLTNPSTLVVFTYAPAGLGHLRVTDALHRGLPEGVEPVLLGSHDRAIQRAHRITSIHPIARNIFEWIQHNDMGFFTKRYVEYLRTNYKELEQQIEDIIDQRIHTPEKLIIVSTHFGLAHQLAVVKKNIEKKKKVKIYLSVIVTDDSPMPIWYVEGADAIFVPSKSTKRELQKYRKREKLTKTKIKVNPYPVNPNLALPLNKKEATDKADQLLGKKKSIEVSVPISGAAVGLMFSSRLFTQLYRKSNRFRFHVVSKVAPFTNSFISRMKKRKYVSVYASDNEKEVVRLYDDIFSENTLSLEITKPSEQSFKALLSANMRGGVLLLFTDPIGRQEEDNLDFLRRHYLVPQKEVNKWLWEMAYNNDEFDNEEIRKLACTWRGLQIPSNPDNAAQFILWALEKGLFSQMLLCRAEANDKDEHKNELGADGVSKFWKYIENHI